MEDTRTRDPGTGSVWTIRDAGGRPVAEHHRFDREDGGKDCFWKLPGTAPDDWGLHGMPLERLPLYGAEMVADLGPDEAVALGEGEKVRDALEENGIPAVGTVTGASGTPGPEALEVLRARTVVLCPDKDGPGRQHMSRVAERLLPIAAEVLVYEDPDLPEGEDLADHPAVKNKDPKDVDRLYNDLLSAPRFGPKGRDGLPFATARQIAHEVPAEVAWRVRPWVADGAITEIDGRVKSAGKTTFAMHLIASALDGRPFMGEPTRKTGVVMLTEQGGPSFSEALKDAALLDRDDLVILRYGDVIGVPWEEVAKAAVAKAEELGYGMLVVDTIGQFAGLKGDAENNAGAALDAMRPLQAAAAKGLAVLFTRHERKSGGEVGTSGRGSSAYSGVVDLILLLRRAEGNVRETVRKIETLGRFHETPTSLMIEKTDRGYVSLGTETAVEKNGARERILRVAPTSEAEAKPKNVILEEASVKYHTGHTVLAELVNEGELRRLGEGKKGDPHRFWRPDPPGDDGEKRSVDHISNVYQQKESSNDIHSVGTPRSTDTKKNGHRETLSVDTTSPFSNRTNADGLSLESAGEEMRRRGSGAAKNLPLYLADRTSLEILTKSVLSGRGMDTSAWEDYAGVVEFAAVDPDNHPLSCECEGVSLMARERFDAQEAERLAKNALVLTEELLDPGREIRETVALHRAADEAARAAAERSRLLSEYHRGMIGLWRRLACAQEVGDMVLVVETVDAIRKATEAEFGRRSTMS